jgi:thymidylate synthase
MKKNLKQDWLQKILKQLIKQKKELTRSGNAHVLIGWHKKFNLDKFPATTSKKLNVDQVAKELYCFLNKLEKKEDLKKHGVFVWDQNIEAAGMDGIGRNYGIQWRSWNNNIDQLRLAVNELKNNKSTRRAVVTAWNPAELDLACLPSCHILFQFNIVNNQLYTSVFQRSADAFLGLPFDIASYALLTRLIQNELGIKKSFLSYYVSNLHLYADHYDKAIECINLEAHNYPKLILDIANNIDNFDYKNVQLKNYKYTKFIKAKMSL